MDKGKFLRIFFVLFIVLAVFFCILLIVGNSADDLIGRIGLWCGLVSQILLALSMYLGIKNDKKNEH